MKKNNVLNPMIVLGLGNPGERYEGTRHNVGYAVADLLIEKPQVRWRRRLFSSYFSALIPGGDESRDIVVVRYTGYMNHSGVPLHGLLKRFGANPDDVLVIVDNMDLPAGSRRLKKGGGNAGHNGLKSVEAHLGSQEYLRLYVGVGRPPKGVSVVDHVLGYPDAGDQMAIENACLASSMVIRKLAVDGFAGVVEKFNSNGSR